MHKTGSSRPGGRGFHGRGAARGRPCSAAAALDIIGDKWTLLIVRELLFGNHRFEQLARNTAAPRDRIVARLRVLEDAQIIERRPYSDHPPRFEYHLTRAGLELAPVLRELRRWGDAWAVEQSPVVFHHTCGHRADTVAVCRHCGGEVRDNEMTPTSQITSWDLHGPTGDIDPAGIDPAHSTAG
jgi:DNA-binding HxlR family transcriptional regulator